MVNAGLYLAYAMFFIALIAAVVMPLLNSLSDPKSLMKAGIGIGAALVVYLIGYVISGNEVTDVYTQFGVDEGSSKTIGGGIIMIYLMAFIAIGGIIFGEISRIIK